MPSHPRTSSLWFRLYAWLSPSEPPAPADLIFVFAGKMDRKQYALDLFGQGLAPAVLLSVARFEIRRFSQMDLPVPLDLLQIAQSVPPPQRHYFVLFANHSVAYRHVPPQRLGTLSETRALARWLNGRPEIRSLLLISNAAHLRRIRLCRRALLDAQLRITFVAAPSRTPVDSASASDGPVREDSAENTPRPTALFQELLKLFAYWFLLRFR